MYQMYSYSLIPTLCGTLQTCPYSLFCDAYLLLRHFFLLILIELDDMTQVATTPIGKYLKKKIALLSNFLFSLTFSFNLHLGLCAVRSQGIDLR